MAFPSTRIQTFVANVTVIGQSFLNGIQDGVIALCLGTKTIKTIHVDQTGGATAPADTRGVAAVGAGIYEGVYGQGGTTDGTGVGGKGGATNGIGVHGVGSGNGAGVKAIAALGNGLEVTGAAVVTGAASADAANFTAGSGAASVGLRAFRGTTDGSRSVVCDDGSGAGLGGVLHIVPSTGTTPPTLGANGELWVSSSGALYYYTDSLGAGMHGNWRVITWTP